MLTKAEILTSLAKEARIITHVASRLRPQDLSFRFTPTQRSTQELLEYLLTLVEGGIAFQLTGSRETAEKRRAAVKNIALADIPAAIAAQQHAVEALLAPLSEAELASRRVKMGQGDVSFAEYLSESIIKYAVAYKMQLFLQAKAAGVPNIGTSDVWRGEETKAKSLSQ